MKKNFITLAAGFFTGIVLIACSNKEIEWESSSEEVLPSPISANEYVTPVTDSVVDLSMIRGTSVSFLDYRTVSMIVDGSERIITLYGIDVPKIYRGDTLNYLSKLSLPDAYINYVDVETGEAYLWTTNDISMISGCINYRMVYEGYALTSNSIVGKYAGNLIEAQNWAENTLSGLWVNPDFKISEDTAIDEPDDVVSDNNVLEED